MPTSHRTTPTTDRTTGPRRLPIVALAVTLTAALVTASCGATEDAVPVPPRDDPPVTGPTGPTEPTGPTGPTDPTEPGTSSPGSTPGGPSEAEQAALRAELESAEARWAAQGIGSYTLAYRPICFCPIGEVEAVVLGGRTMVTRVSGDLSPETPGRSVEEWFDIVRGAIGTAFDVQVDYADEGQPVRVYIDEDETIADDEWGMQLVELADRTQVVDQLVSEAYGCAYGFWTATAEQDVSMRIALGGFDPAGPTAGTYDVRDALEAELLFGTDLMANWCDDVVEPDEPVPDVRETWQLTAGTIDLALDGGSATATITGLVATTPDGVEVPLGDATVDNPAWGRFAG